jgi:hypothetical protein
LYQELPEKQCTITSQHILDTGDQQSILFCTTPINPAIAIAIAILD